MPSFVGALTFGWQDLMCVLGWLNHHRVRFQREVAAPLRTATGHPLQLNTIVTDSRASCMSQFCADISAPTSLSV